MTVQTQTPFGTSMRGITAPTPGGPEALILGTHSLPTPQKGEILIRVTAAGVNRPDILQRMGKYPPPAGITDILGLEVAGKIVAAGPETPLPHPLGTRVCALVAGGGYAEYVTAPIGQILPVPDTLSDDAAAALPEGLFTVWKNLFVLGRFQVGASVLIHGGASGIGTLAIQMARVMGAGDIFVTCGSDEKGAACRALGATHAINYKAEDFASVITDKTNGRGVDIVLDMVGGDYVPRNLSCLAYGGRHVTIAMMNGATATIDLRRVMVQNLTLTGSTLRARSLDEKRALRDEILAHIWPHVVAGRIAPVIHGTFPLTDAAAAHTALESGGPIGKIVLTI